MLSIIIPVKEPEPHLKFLIAEIDRTVTCPYEILVQREKGLGYAVMCGVKRARGNLIAVCDADGSHPISALPEMIWLAEKSEKKYDVVVGSRYVAGGDSFDSFVRRFISRVYCSCIRRYLRLPVKDCMSGFVVARRILFVWYPIENCGYKFLMELLYRGRGVVSVVEVPIVFCRRKAGKSKASLREGWRTLVFVVWLRLHF